MLGNRLAYWLGSASDSAALGFTFFRSSRHRPTTCQGMNVTVYVELKPNNEQRGSKGSRAPLTDPWAMARLPAAGCRA